MTDKESIEYEASTVVIGDLNALFRIGKITPKKSGQFVTLWKRANSGKIVPYDSTDPFELVIISVAFEKQLGQFIFPKEVLVKQKIISKNHQGGKLAFRIYPPWDTVSNKQGKKSQTWQCEYFFEASPTLDQAKMNVLFLQTNSSQK